MTNDQGGTLNRALKSSLIAGALAVSTLAIVDAQPASATSVWVLQNVATGKCLKTSTTAPTTTTPTMATCNKSSVYQQWSWGSGHVRLSASSSNTINGVCLGVQKSPSGEFARQVVATTCGSTTYNLKFTTALSSNYPLASISPSCYVGQYSSSDTYPICYTNDGKYTRWNWVPVK
ncbi:ricin-type beta-trefoil lectin domain protein [Actinacidiphila sp. bgisy145]|uniref:ricin-type beta-trefoil lectin domain protein n=1 Tax=Actinacidiphila sp. bgisy145 TaxID=3413792 RepID=UPI003EBE6D76